MIDTNTAKKEIVLTLTNNSSTTDASIDLFSFGSNSSSPSTSLQYVGVNTADFVGTSNWLFRYYPLGSSTLTSTTITDPTDIDDLITKLNASFGDIFWYEADSITHDFNLKVASIQYDFDSYRPTALSPFVFFTTGTQTFINNSTVQVQMGYNVSYNSVCTDLTNQPYFISTIYVSSSSQSQTTQQLLSTITEASGVSKQKPITPIVDPNQSQNVQMTIPIYMPTSAMNTLTYTVLAGQSVIVVVRYIKISLEEGLRLIETGDFQKEMALLRDQDTKEYQRIMDIVKGFDVIAKQESPITWNPPKLFVKAENVPRTTIFAVPLIYVIAKENGNPFVEML